jgi:hypothetical protein
MKIPFIKKRSYEEFDTFAKIRFTISFIVVFLLLILMIFLYRDFYRTIVQANEVIVLKQEVALQNIDLTVFNSIFSLHTYKRKEILPEIIPNPFKTDTITTDISDIIKDDELEE